MVVKYLLSLCAGLAAFIAAVCASDENVPQTATQEDTKIFLPYIGKFRSESRMFDDGKTEHYFTIDHQWYDDNKTMVKYQIHMVIPSQDREIFQSEGFYGYYPPERRLFVFGAFKQGNVGWGSIARFNHETGMREVWVNGVTADGKKRELRDHFELIDQDIWKNTTRIRIGGEDSDWQIVHEAVYTRITEEQ